MKNLHFARFIQNNIVIIDNTLRHVKTKLSHFAKILQNTRNTMRIRSNITINIHKSTLLRLLLAGIQFA